MLYEHSCSFPYDLLPADFSPDKPYWVRDTQSANWIRFQSLSHFMSWQGSFQTIKWDWMMWEGIHTYIDETEPTDCDEMVRALISSGAQGMLMVVFNSVSYIFDLEKIDCHPSFDSFAHLALCDMYEVRRISPDD